MNLLGALSFPSIAADDPALSVPFFGDGSRNRRVFPQAEDAESTTSKWGTAQLQTDQTGLSACAASARFAVTARLVATIDGKPRRLIAAEPRDVTVLVQIGCRTNTYNLNPDSVVAL
jgi:hypothetical protein